ncbi:MAG: HIRAN domain-containing protein [Planctomycetia bacterium]|nr:HIRAN domain-containing protein [Planctomycetia bacterium]
MNSLFVAWRPEMPEQAGWTPVARLEHDGGLYRFCYTQGARTPGFRPFPQMKRMEQVYESEALFPLFANRLLSRSRPEYEAYLRWSGFDPDSAPDPIVVLSVTEGIRQTDAIEVFPCPVPDANGCFLNKFFLHGIRWMPPAVIERIARLETRERLRLMADFQNTADPRAVAVRTASERMLLGYVPRYLARDVWTLVQKCEVDFIELSVERVNPDAPLQNRLLCRMQACWPNGFQPCTGDEFVPIPATVPRPCAP